MTDIHQFNKGAKSWRIYARELTSKSGDTLDISSSGNIIFKGGEIISKGDLIVENKFLPKENENIDIGSTDKPFSDLYISQLIFKQSTSDYKLTLIPTANMSENITFKLPNTTGTSGQVLQTDGSGLLTWTNQSGGGGNTNNIKLTINKKINFESELEKMIDNMKIDEDQLFSYDKKNKKFIITNHSSNNIKNTRKTFWDKLKKK